MNDWNDELSKRLAAESHELRRAAPTTLRADVLARLDEPAPRTRSLRVVVSGLAAALVVSVSLVALSVRDSQPPAAERSQQLAMLREAFHVEGWMGSSTSLVRNNVGRVDRALANELRALVVDASRAASTVIDPLVGSARGFVRRDTN